MMVTPNTQRITLCENQGGVMKPTSRKTAELSESAGRRLNAYALAATAAGVPFLALAGKAEARIVYTPTNVHISQYNLDLNGDGQVDFVFNDFYAHGSTSNDVQLVFYSGRAMTINKAIAKNYSFSPLPRGVRVGPGDHFSMRDNGAIMADVLHRKGKTYYSGKWANGGKGVKNRYLGLKFIIKGKYHYGWARLNVSVTGAGPNATLTGYAYETIPSKAIITGKTKGPDVIKLEPASLGRIALGSAGLAARASSK
jgi:hypothetical protein